MITYEYPLNERIRTLLRLEDLFERSRHFIARTDPLDHHVALLTLFEILEVSSRADLKSDLLQELERQKQVLLSFRNNPEISEEALASVLRDIEQAAAALFSMAGKIGQYIRENDWLMSIKQRTGIPGGACEFDLPSYHFWLHRPAEERIGQLAAWTGPLFPIRDGSAIILRILRESGKAQRLTAPLGTFQQMLGGKTAQMLRVRLDDRDLRARDQRQQVRAQHPLPYAGERGPQAARRRLGRGLRADVLQPVRTVPCPRCGAGAAFGPANRWRPFCSERCRLIDLGQWAAEAYRVPQAERGPDEPET